MIQIIITCEELLDKMEQIQVSQVIPARPRLYQKGKSKRKQISLVVFLSLVLDYMILNFMIRESLGYLQF